MAKKVKKKTTQNKKIYLIAIGVIIIILILRYGASLVSKTHVLGTSTSILLADKGSGDLNNEGSDSNLPEKTPSTISNTSGSSSTNADTSTSSNTVSNASSDTKVDCVGPDGKHFTTSFHACQELNQNWNHKTIFTPLSGPKPVDLSETENQSTPEAHNSNIKVSDKSVSLETQTEGTKGEFNLESSGTQIEMKREDNGALKIHAKKPDGTEVELQSNAIDSINESLKDKSIEVSTDSAKNFVINSKGTKAFTNFPISVNPTTGALAVTTGNGKTKDLNVMPNQAIQNILDQKLLTNVLSTTTESSTSGSPIVTLSEVNNDPAFEVQGILSKKLLGIFPVGFQKTVFVSAVDGQVLKTDESLINKVLQAFSF